MRVIRHMKKKALIGIMVSTSEDLKPVLKKYDRYKGSLSVRLFTFTPQDIHWETKTIRGLCLKNEQWKERTFRFPDAVYNRCYRRKTKKIQRLEACLGPNKCFNRVTHINKWRVYQELKKSNLQSYIPETSLYLPDRLRDLLQVEPQLIVKPCYGNKGKKVYIVEKTEDHLFKIYEDTFTPIYTSGNEDDFFQEMDQLIAGEKFLIQRMIHFARVEGKIADCRILMQKDVTGCWNLTKGISRIAPSHFYITSRAEEVYEMDEVLKVLFRNPSDIKSQLRKIRRLSIRIAQLLDKRIGLLGEIGLDIAIDEEGAIWLIEVNGKPQKAIFRMMEGIRCSGIDSVYKLPIEYAYYLSQT